MSPIVARHGWETGPGMIAWPHGWQRPARTEEWAYERRRAAGRRPAFAQLVCFPWASAIDLLDRGRLDRVSPYLDALASAPPRTTLVRATVCQHIEARRAWPWLRALGITDVFWSHARVDEPVLEGIRIHPFPLYPVRCLQGDRPLGDASPPVDRRRLLYSFVGAYSAGGYLTPVRRWIYELPERPDATILRREAWHYESAVYGEQVANRPTNSETRLALERNAQDFDTILGDSVFSLCPSGSGPNSIRLWESLGFGCIPVLLADTLRLPGPEHAWRDAIVRVPETREAVAALPARLAELARDRDRIARMRAACEALWTRYGERGPDSVLESLDDVRWIKARVAGSAEPACVATTT